MHVEEDVATSVSVALNRGLQSSRHFQVVVGEPGLLLDIVDITDIVTLGTENTLLFSC